MATLRYKCPFKKGDIVRFVCPDSEYHNQLARYDNVHTGLSNGRMNLVLQVNPLTGGGVVYVYEKHLQLVQPPPTIKPQSTSVVVTNGEITCSK